MKKQKHENILTRLVASSNSINHSCDYNYLGTAGDAFSTHKGMAFTTKDSDNDTWSSNCAVEFKGAWWYRACHGSNLNGLYHHGSHTSYADGINWYNWKGYYYSLKSTSMKTRPREFGLKK